MDKEYAFALVEFDEGPQLISNRWFCSEKDVFWPDNLKSNKEYYKAVQKHIEPNASWGKYKIKKIYKKRILDYDSGMRKLKELEDFTDINSTDSEHPSRRAFRKQKFMPKLPSPPLTPTSTYPESIISLNTPSSTNASIPLGNNDATMLIKIMTSVTEMNTKLNYIISKINELQNVSEQITDEAKELLLDKRPFLITLEEFKSFESKLSDKEVKQKAFSELIRIGGSDTKLVVYNILKVLLTNNVLSKFSFYGAKGKLRFENSNIHKLIIDITKHVIHEATETGIKCAIMEYLKNAAAKAKRDSSAANASLVSDIA